MASEWALKMREKKIPFVVLKTWLNVRREHGDWRWIGKERLIQEAPDRLVRYSPEYDDGEDFGGRGFYDREEMKDPSVLGVRVFLPDGKVVWASHPWYVEFD